MAKSTQHDIHPDPSTDQDQLIVLIGNLIARTKSPEEACEALYNSLLIPYDTASAAIFDMLNIKDTKDVPQILQSLAQHVLNGPKICGFVTARTPEGLFAATSRLDRPYPGLPGGKNDIGETLHQTCLREAQEEGWDIGSIMPRPYHVQLVDDAYLCAWYESQDFAFKRSDYKEKGRITPLAVPFTQLAQGTLGNEKALPVFMRLQD